jgi:hypothetical protein
MGSYDSRRGDRFFSVVETHVVGIEKDGCGVAKADVVLVSREYRPAGRGDRAVDVLVLGRVVGDLCPPVDFDVVVHVPLESRHRIEIVRLHRAVAGDGVGERRFVATPRFTVFLPRLYVSHFNARKGE